MAKSIKVIVGKSDITKYVTKVEWSGENSQISRTLQLSIANDPYDKNFKHKRFSNGTVVKFYYGKTRKFVGRITNSETKSEIGTVDYTARDYMYNLVQSTATYKFKNKTPEYITRAICKDFNMQLGKLPKTHHRIKKYIPSDMSPYNIIIKAFQKAEKYTKKKYMLRMNGTKLEVIERGKLIKSTIRTGQNILDSTKTEDSSDVVNKVIAYNSKGHAIGVYKLKKSIKKYGIKQTAINVDKGKGKKESKNSMKGISKEASVTCLGNIALISGYAVNVVSTAGLNGKYYIKSDTHTWENGTYQTSIDLQFNNADEDISYSKIDENAKKTTNEDGSVTTIKKKTYKAYFTAYSENTGSGKDCKGHKLHAENHTCATAKKIPYGTKMKISCPGTSIDKKTYKCTDRPLHGTLKGKLHVDILFKTEAEARKFGTHTGKVTVYKKVTTDGSVTGGTKKGRAIVKKALTKIGCRYVYGTDGPNTFDCSGFVWWVYKQCGYHFTRGSAASYNSLGNRVSFKNLQPGDIILYSTNGNANGIHHTGLYIGGGKMVHAPNHKERVKISSITSGYYRNQFYCGRRL